MAKEIRTMTGATYVVTMTEAGTVKGVYNAQEIVLVSLEQPGQATFQAISNQTVLSDDAAIVNPTDASALFVGASSGGVSSGQVEAVVQDAIYAGEEVGQWTPTGTDNATCNYFEIAATHSFSGVLSSISYRVGWDEGPGMTSEPLWLAVWEQSLDGDAYELLGVSRNSLSQEIAGTLTWYFDSLSLHGRRLRFVPTTSAAQTEPGTTVKLRCRVSASTDGSVLSFNGVQSNYIPVMMMAGIRLTPRYAAQADVSSHVADNGVHVTAAERSAWNAKANAADLTDHVGDSVAHLTEAEHSSLAELIEGGSSITIDDNPTAGSYNAVSSGGVYSSLHGSGGASTKVGDDASASQNESVAIGSFAMATDEGSTAIGSRSSASGRVSLAVGVAASARGWASMTFGSASLASGDGATAVGASALAEGTQSVAVGEASGALGEFGVAVGNGASVSSRSSSAIGSGAYCGDVGVLALKGGGNATDGKSTQIYLIPAGSPMAATYTDGEAGLGYVVLDHISGSVIAQGVVKLSSVCTDHSSDFAPTNVQSIEEY